MNTIYDTVFQVRRGHLMRICGIPTDLTVRECERLVRMLRTLALPEDSVEVCACGCGATYPGNACPACGKRIPEREKDASDLLAGMTPGEIVTSAMQLLGGRPE